jgi:hypothetical protein
MVLIVVARSEPALYQYIAGQYSHEPEVEVVVDRRHGERRQRHAPPSEERRRADRRQHQVDRLLGLQGWATVRRQPGPRR